MFDSTFIFLTGGFLFLLGLIIGVTYLLYAEHTVHELDDARMMNLPHGSLLYSSDNYADKFLYKIEKAKQFAHYAFFFSGFGFILMILSRSRRKQAELDTPDSN